jgi:hypothetical protein
MVILTVAKRSKQMTMIMETEASLCAEYDAWLKEHNYPELSADELSLEIQGDLPRSELPADKLADVQWLDWFIARWNDAV